MDDMSASPVLGNQPKCRVKIRTGRVFLRPGWHDQLVVLCHDNADFRLELGHVKTSQPHAIDVIYSAHNETCHLGCIP